MTLSFFVEKQKITRTDTETPAANSNCYLKAKFEFGNDWDTSSSVCPIFRRGGEDSGYIPKLTNGSFLDEQNICFVPIEVLNKEGRFFVSILDYKSGKTITTNEAMVEVSRSGPVFNSPTIYSLDLRFENENLQLTANGEAVGAGVTLPSGLRLINSITVADGGTATMLKISKDVDGASFSLHNIMFAARLNLPSAQTVTIRLRTNDGGRYLVFKTGVKASGVLFVSGESKVFSIGTNTNAEYITANADLVGTTTGTAVQTFASNSTSKKNISDVEIFLYDASNNFVQLQPGTTLEVWGC